MSSAAKHQDSHVRGTVPCIVCKEPIHRGARICTQCKSWQDWTRHLTRWSTTIAAALAIVPLWTGAVSLYKIAFHHAAEIKIQALTCDISAVTLVVTNSGDRAGILGSSSLSLQVNDISVGKPITLRAVEEHPVVRPRETFVLRLEPRVEGVPSVIPVPTNAKTCAYHVATEVREFERGSHEALVSCACPASPATH